MSQKGTFKLKSVLASICKDRPLWRKMIHSGLEHDHKLFLAHLEQEALKRHQRRGES